MSALPTRADLAGTPTRAELQTILLAMYDMVAQRLAAGTTGAGTASDAELRLARNSLGLGAGADIASAATLDLTTRTGNVVRVTGTTPTDTITLETGGVVFCIAAAAWPLTYHATTNPVQGGQSYTCEAGDIVVYMEDGSNVLHNWVIKPDGAPVAGVDSAFDLTASVGSNALTITLKKGGWFFRNPTLGTGEFEYVRTNTDLTLTISSGSTLGGVNQVPTGVLVRVVNDGGTLRLTAENQAGGMDSSETGVISTTAEGGAGGADSSTTIYSATAVTSKAYRCAGIVVSTQATAGTWATAPSLVQGAGGNAITSMSSIGYGQTWQNVAASRAAGTTYYNTTGRPIQVSLQLTALSSSGATSIVTVGGVTIGSLVGDGGTAAAFSVGTCFIVPPGSSYSVSSFMAALRNWVELR